MVDISRRRVGAGGETPAHETALAVLQAGIEAAQPSALLDAAISRHESQLTIESVDGTTVSYDLEGFDDVALVGGGNAAGTLAAAFEDHLGDRLIDGIVVTDAPEPTSTVEVLSGDHPLPSAAGVRHSTRVLERAERAGPDDLLFAVVTGGASSLLESPAAPLSVADLQATTEALLSCGASIDEINAVRKHCSAIKGGQLARAAAPATVVTLLVSDVIGDDPSVIGSGPTAPDPTTYADALDVLERYDLAVPETVRDHLEAGDAGDRAETPAPGDSVLEAVDTHLLGSNRTALEAAGETAADRGYTPLILSARVRGEARDAAVTHVAIAEECHETGTPVEPPAVLLSGGETTVTLGDDPGRGGPNQEFVTSAGLELEADDVVIASVDTDGIDGATDAAGAIADRTTLPAVDGRQALERHDVTSLLEANGAILETGPTGTNVNDLRAFVVQ